MKREEGTVVEFTRHQERAFRRGCWSGHRGMDIPVVRPAGVGLRSLDRVENEIKIRIKVEIREREREHRVHDGRQASGALLSS